MPCFLAYYDRCLLVILLYFFEFLELLFKINLVVIQLFQQMFGCNILYIKCLVCKSTIYFIVMKSHNLGLWLLSPTGIRDMFTDTAMKVVNLHQDEDHSVSQTLSTSQFSMQGKGGSLRPQHLRRHSSNPSDQQSPPAETPPNIRIGSTQNDNSSEEPIKKKGGWCSC